MFLAAQQTQRNNTKEQNKSFVEGFLSTWISTAILYLKYSACTSITKVCKVAEHCNLQSKKGKRSKTIHDTATGINKKNIINKNLEEKRWNGIKVKNLSIERKLKNVNSRIKINEYSFDWLKSRLDTHTKELST